MVCLFVTVGVSGEKSSPHDEYLGTWEGFHLDITTTVVFKDSSHVIVGFLLDKHNEYIRRTGYWRISDKMVEIKLDFEETTKYTLQIKKFANYLNHKFTIVDRDIGKAILVDAYASTYTVFKIKDKRGKKIKWKKPKI